MDLENIIQRDRWSCRRCGHKFDGLTVCRFGKQDAEDELITLCSKCIEWANANLDEARTLFTKLLRRTKVVLIGDCHGNFERLDEVLSGESPFDFFICTGDVATLSDMGLVNNHNIIDKWGDKGYFVYGTHDNVSVFTPLELTQEIHGIKVAGLNGILRGRNFIKDTSRNISFREILYLSHQTNIDILVSHQPPTGVFSGFGEPALEELLNYLVPKIYVFGHVHKFKLKFHLNTFVISLPLVSKGHAIAYFQGNDLRNLEIMFKKGKRFIRV